MNIIGINGFKRSGKGETGLAIAKLVEGVELLGFADKLKILAARTLGYLPEHYTDEQCIALMDAAKEKWHVQVRSTGNNVRIKRTVTLPSGRADKRTGLTMREFLQNLGNEARGVFGEDFWVDQVLPRAIEHTPGMDQLDHDLANARACRMLYPGAAVLAFTDLRYENEAQRIKDLGGFNIEVVRPGVESDGHASERRLPRNLIDHVIHNTGTLADLQWEVNKVLELEGLC